MNIRDLGAEQPFDETWELQERLRIQRAADLIPDTVLLLEHQPVYTIGRTRDTSSLGETSHLPHQVITLNRGGQATYHGPGQLTGYAIVDLNSHGRDLHLHLRRLEEAIILTLADLGLTAARREGLTGVWLEDRKIAALGVGVRRWVTQHGFALNVTAASLPPFDAITPCGLHNVTTTSIETELGTAISIDDVKKLISKHLKEVFATLH